MARVSLKMYGAPPGRSFFRRRIGCREWLQAGLIVLLTLLPRTTLGDDRSATLPAYGLYSSLSTDESTALLQSISAHLGAVRSFDANFFQEHHLAMYLDVLKARGVSAFQSPDRFRWELTDPYRSVLIYNRGNVAKFEERNGRMQRVDSGAYDLLRNLMGQMTAWMRGDFKDAQTRFNLRALVGPEYQLELTPKAKEMLQYVRRIEVYLHKDPITIARIVIREPEEDFIEIRFENLHQNSSPADALFDTKNQSTTTPVHEKP